MYLVLCFAFEGSNDVTLECLTKNIDLANIRYQDLINYNIQNEQKDLVELVEVNDQFDDSFCFYWGKEVPGIKILKSNNRS